MGYYKKILKWFINIFTSILLVLLAIVIYGKATVIFGNNVYPNYFGYTFFSIASGSMEPTLYVNDVILVKISNEIKEGDIISYSKNKEVITHRVISISNNSITVKGDNNNTIDEPIDKSQVIGKVIKTYPRLSIWQKVITEPKILIAIFVTFLLFDFALSYKGKDKKEEKKKEMPKEEKVVEEKIETPKEETIKVEEIIAKDTDKKKEALLEATVVLDTNELKELCKAKEEDIFEEEIEEEVIEEGDPSKYTVRLDLNEINKRIKNKVK